MASTLTIPLTVLPVGPLSLGPLAVADADTTINLVIDRTVAGGLNSLTAASVLAVTVDQSNDGGATWGMIAGCTWPGGIRLEHGTTVTSVRLNTGMLPGTSRQLRAHVIVSGTPIAVAGTLIVA